MRGHKGKKYWCENCLHFHGWNSKGHREEGCEFPEKIKKFPCICGLVYSSKSDLELHRRVCF